MRRTQQENRQRRAEKARKDSEPANAYKMPRFKGVEPRAVKQANTASSPPGGAKHSGYLRRTSVGSGVVLSPRSTMTNERLANTPAGRAAAAALSPRPYVSSKVSRKAAVPLTSQGLQSLCGRQISSPKMQWMRSQRSHLRRRKRRTVQPLCTPTLALCGYLQRRKVGIIGIDDAQCP